MPNLEHKTMQNTQCSECVQLVDHILSLIFGFLFCLTVLRVRLYTVEVNLCPCCCCYFSIAVILNPNDFDFLLSKGTGSQQINPRDSILERFDPISGRKSIVLPSSSVKGDLLPTPTISTIPEAECSTTDSTINESDASLIITDVKSSLFDIPFNSNSSSNNKKVEIKRSPFDEQIVKLDSSDTFDTSQLGDGDHSQASSTTETYETASSGEPYKVSESCVCVLLIWIA